MVHVISQPFAPLAQLEERITFNVVAMGSSPIRGNFFSHKGYFFL